MSDPRQRDEARRHGWTGPLRGELHEPDDGGSPWPGPVAAAVEALVPGVRVTPRRSGRRGAGRLFHHAMSGMPDTADLTVEDERGRFTVRYPDRPELFVEELARSIDIAVSLRRRFGAALDHVSLVKIDYGPQGFRTARYAGVVMPNLGTVHLNASLMLPDGPQRPPSKTPPHQPVGIYTRTDFVTAHEFWHQVELAFQARHYRDSIEFRRQVGAYFGVATIEQAVINPGEAHDRLVREVSAYAGTLPLEATAEMAALWWLTRDDPPPVAASFGQVVGRFFPVMPR